MGNPSWGKNLEESSTVSELISELRKDFYLIFSLELCLNTIFSGKNMRRTPWLLKTTKIARTFFVTDFPENVYGWAYPTMVTSPLQNLHFLERSEYTYGTRVKML